MEVSYLYPHELEYGRWHRSRDIKDGDFPFGSFMINKKWWLEEELNNVLLQFQQVRLREGLDKKNKVGNPLVANRSVLLIVSNRKIQPFSTVLH